MIIQGLMEVLQPMTILLVAIGTVLTLPVFVPMMLMLVSHSLVPSWLMNPWLQAILITPVMFYCGAPIHRVGWPALWHRHARSGRTPVGGESP